MRMFRVADGILRLRCCAVHSRVIGRSPQPELRPVENLAAGAHRSLQARAPPQIPNRVQAPAQPRAAGERDRDEDSRDVFTRDFDLPRGRDREPARDHGRNADRRLVRYLRR